MKKNLQTIISVLTIVVILSLGCGMLGGSKVSNEQISNDLIAKGLLTKGASSFDFAGDLSSHCFKIKDSKVDGDKADLKIFLTADEVQTGGTQIKILTADLGMVYKKDGDKWKLENLDLINFDAKTISAEKAISDFAPLEKPVCAEYSRPYNSKKK